MIEANTKCTIKKIPGEGTYDHLLHLKCTAVAVKGLRDTGTQQFKLDTGAIYGNGDSGFIIEAD